jgi:MFS family permease
MAIGRFGDHFGRRRWYAALYLALAITGIAFATSRSLWVLVAVSLTGALSTEVVESGPFTSLEQAMLATDFKKTARLRGFGTYNAVATVGGSLGALAAALPGALTHAWQGAPSAQRWFFLFVPVAAVGTVFAAGLSPAVEHTTPSAVATAPGSPAISRLGRSRSIVMRLSALFALDSFGGGFVVQAFVAYWLSRRFGASVSIVAVVFFAVGILQTFSFLSASRLGERFGMLPTMVFTHLPSNLLLVALAFSPSLSVAVALLLARTALSQMDVPVRQAYVMALVESAERTPAAAYTNTARYVARPAGTVLAGVAASAVLASPFAIGGVIKGMYDVILWTWFRRVPLPKEVPSL